jgi:hypothetical protein
MRFHVVRVVSAAAAVAVILLGVATASADTGDPAAFAQELYALPNHWADVTADNESREKYLAPSLAELVAKNDKAEEFNRIDYDPLTDRQPGLRNHRSPVLCCRAERDQGVGSGRLPQFRRGNVADAGTGSQWQCLAAREYPL